jgi:uncharacterized small protein (DUF1192 family)
MDGGAHRRGGRRIPAPEAPSGSRRSRRLRARAGIIGPAPRVIVSDSESVNRFSGSAGHSGSDPFFIPGLVPGLAEEGGPQGPQSPAGEVPEPVAHNEGDGAVGDGQGHPTPGAEFAFSVGEPSRERRTPKETKAHDFRQGVRLGRLENRVACLEAEIRRLKGQLRPLREKLRNRRMMMGDEYGLDVYIAGGFSTDED